MDKYRLLSKTGEGTFSDVIKAQHLVTGKFVAIKCLKNKFESLKQVNNLREVQALRRLSPHPCMVKLLEIVFDETKGLVGLVFELMEMNLYEYIKDRKQFLPETRVREIILNVVKALEYMHRNHIFHRDIKPENILIKGDSVKLADFGSCKSMNSALPYTEYISTRWYRPPECLMTDGYYDYKMDIWGIGCVLFEIVALYPLFQGTNELDQVNKIHAVIGTPGQETLNNFRSKASHMKFEFERIQGTGINKLIPHASNNCKDLINKMIEYHADQRITAAQALRHPFLSGVEKETLSAESLANGRSVNDKYFRALPLIKNAKKKKKDENSNKTIGFLTKSPYSVKDSILKLRKAYAPADKKYYKSSY